MKMFPMLVVVALIGTGAALAEEKFRFEVSAESGRASVLSGPAVRDFSNKDGRFGFAPSKEFQITLLYSKWEGEIGPGDSLGQDFARDINRTRPANSQFNFRNSKLDKNDVDFEQWELGVVRSIEIDPKHWEGFVGLGAGIQKSTADWTYIGPCTAPNTPPNCFIPPANDPMAKPIVKRETTNEFMTSVRGGMRYYFVNWVGAELNFRWIPIAKMFGRNYNGLELNAGIVFKFGKIQPKT